MSKDVNYWKEAYKHLWSKSAAKEDILKEIIERETGYILEPFGLGATSEKFISGSAIENGYEIASPDFQVKGLNIFIEVTGPLNDYTKPQQGLWIRPDKINYAKKYKGLIDEFFVLYFPSVDEWYVIHANEEFFTHLYTHKEKTDYFRKNPVIRDRKEKCIEIKLTNPFVKDLSALVNYLNTNK